MSKKLWQLADKVGHRGAFLLLLAIFDVIYGWSLFAEPGPTGHITMFFPLHVWGIFWFMAGMIMFTGVLAKRDYFQFALAAVLKCIWAAAWLDLFLFGNYTRAWVNGVIWLVFALLVLLISSWPDIRIVKRDKPDMNSGALEDSLPPEFRNVKRDG